MDDGSEDGEDEYVAGDPERVTRTAPVRLRYERPGHPLWHALRPTERVAVVRWLQRGDAGGLLIALSGNPSLPGLRSFVAEAIAGGPVTGWRMGIASPDGGRPTNADKATLSALQAILVGDGGDGGDVAALAGVLAGITKGKRNKRGRFRDPMQVAMVGLVTALFRAPGKSHFDAVMEAALALAEEAPKDGDDPRNMKRVGQLYDEFLRAGVSSSPPKRK